MSLGPRMSAALREGLLAHGHRRRHAAGETIFSQGDAGDVLYVITRGRIEVSRSSMGGRRSVMNHMGAGELLGEIATLDAGERTADATAATDVELLAISRAQLGAYLAANPQVMMDLTAELCGRVREAVALFDDQAQLGARTRLARCILRIGDKWGVEDGEGFVTIPIPLSQSDFGELAGISRENVNRHLRAMVSEGLVEHSQGAVTIRDAEALRDIGEV